MAGDANFDKVALLLHMDGADGSTTFNDRSPTAKAIAASGNAKVSAAAAYTISTPYSGEHTVVAYPVTGENLPALVHHGVIPI